MVSSTEYESESVPPEHRPFTPSVFADTTSPIGLAAFTPDYRETTITAFNGAAVRVARTDRARLSGFQELRLT